MAIKSCIVCVCLRFSISVSVFLVCLHYPSTFLAIFVYICHEYAKSTKNLLQCADDKGMRSIQRAILKSESTADTKGLFDNWLVLHECGVLSLIYFLLSYIAVL